MARSTSAQFKPIDRTNDCLVSGIETREILGVNKSTIQRRMRNDPQFPKPVRVKLNRLSFWKSDIYRYLDLVQDT
jgi:predicted DNA-binding transcriptional regulator AlpA